MTVDGAVVRKPSFDAPEDAAVTLDPTAPALVSRAQQKLDAAMARFALDCTGLTVLDVGASTRRLHPLPARPRRRTRLRARRGARPASPLAAREQPRDGAGGRQRPHDDARAVSRPAGYGGDGRFVYLAIAHLSRARRRSAARSRLVTLVKPQFEAGRAHIGKGGLVKPSDRLYGDIFAKLENAAAENGWRCWRRCPPPCAAATATPSSSRFSPASKAGQTKERTETKG